MKTANDLRNAFEVAGCAPNIAQEEAHRMAGNLNRFPIEGFEMLRPERVSPTEAIVEYRFGVNQYSIENASPEASPNFRQSDHGGTQLDRENILFFARASEIAGAVVPAIWLTPNQELVSQVINPNQHLDTLNEFWWLSRWLPGAHIQRGVKINPSSKKDVDWRLSWNLGLGSSVTINLEIKRRVGCDLLRFARGEEVNPDQLFEAKINGKFIPSAPHEVNVLGLTLLGEIDREIQIEAGKWIKTRADIDALLLFSRFSLRHSGFDVHIRSKGALLSPFLCRQLGPRDLCLHSRVGVPLPFQFPEAKLS